MFLYRSAVAALALAAVGFAQTAPTPPRPPRGRSIVVTGIGKRGYLGVGVIELTAERAKALKLGDTSGVEVTSVTRNSPASAAGIKEGDVILEVNNKKVDDVEEFIRTVGDTDPGSKLTLTAWREGAKQALTATLRERPLQQLMMPDGNLSVLPALPDLPNGGWSPVFTGQSPRVGFEGETLSPQLAEYFGVKEGVLVRTVTSKTPAEKAGLKAGDVIIKVNGTPVMSPREISGLVRASHTTFTFTVVRNHKEITLNVEVAGTMLPAPDREVL